MTKWELAGQIATAWIIASVFVCVLWAWLFKKYIAYELACEKAEENKRLLRSALRMRFPKTREWDQNQAFLDDIPDEAA